MEKEKINEIIDTITIRMEEYMEAITDCCGDRALFESLALAIEEDKYILDLLIMWPFNWMLVHEKYSNIQDVI